MGLRDFWKTAKGIMDAVTAPDDLANADGRLTNALRNLIPLAGKDAVRAKLFEGLTKYLNETAKKNPDYTAWYLAMKIKANLGLYELCKELDIDDDLIDLMAKDARGKN
ncbi:hypothetical protein LCGC14_0686620 [marine sediment metagenome]|uniref:Uncharacterized protein n=1 Tax=marine sediment metagenome TaxID=412755 RepID=A0A0F9QLL7_9ZZZZ